jgi:putative peptidoglycan lipid II flippase
MQACVTTIPVVRHGWPGRLPFNDERVFETLKLILPFVLLGLITRIGPVFERFFASGLPDGDLSYIGYANKTVRIFQSMLAVTVVTATFPVMSKNFARDGVRGLLSTFKYSARLTLAVAIPVVTIGTVIALPLIEVLFERGVFTHEDTIAVARILPIILLEAILFAMIGNLLTRAFYVTKDTRTVPIVTSSAIIPYVFVAYWATRQWGYVGLAAAGAFYAFLGVIVLFALLLRRYSRQQLSLIKGARYFLLYGALGAMAALVAYWILGMLGNALPLVQLLAAGATGALGYVLMLSLVDRQIAIDMLAIVGITQLGVWLQKQYRLSRRRFGVSGAPRQG